MGTHFGFQLLGFLKLSFEFFLFFAYYRLRFAAQLMGCSFHGS
jgi:hypothetical protein